MAEPQTAGPQARRPARPPKSAEAFRTIGEVSETLDVPQHVLRFWETKFSQIRPLKRGGRRRYYRPADVAMLRGLRDLLYEDGYTIRGVRKLLSERGVKVLQDRADAAAPPPPSGEAGKDGAGRGGAGRAEIPQAGAAQGARGKPPPGRSARGAALAELAAELDELRRALDEAM